uniref:Uncharacterized protein n=1 Tax=Biomphalaria glabrata TaxID=6526 RepID=A0A2C9LLJ7_BIOGL
MSQEPEASDKDFLMIRYLSDNVVVPDLRKETTGDRDDQEDDVEDDDDTLFNLNQNLGKDKTNCHTSIEEHVVFLNERSKSSTTMVRRHSSMTRKKQFMENTYRMEPKPGQYFIWWKIRRRFDYPRYRFVCHVTLVQLRRQGIIISDRSLWNTAVDNYAVCLFKNRTAVCVVTLHGIYME